MCLYFPIILEIFVQEQILPVGSLCHKMYFCAKFLLVLMVRRQLTLEQMSGLVLVQISDQKYMSLAKFSSLHFFISLLLYLHLYLCIHFCTYFCLTGGGVPDHKYATRHSRGC